MAATAAGKGKARAKPPVAVQDDVPVTASGFPRVIRASRVEPEDEVVDEEEDDLTISPLVPLPPPSATDDSDRRYMRPVPDVPGIIRASREEEALAEDLAKPAPIFSNEGIVRAAAARHRNRVLAPIADLGGALLDAGSALGHGISSNIPGAKVAVASPGASARVASPDFDKYGNPRRSKGNRRALALVGIAGVIIALVAASYMFLPGPDLNGFPLIPNSSNDTKDVIGDRTANPDDPDGIAIGDASGGPNGGRASRAPTSSYLPYCNESVPTPTPTPTPTATPSSSASPTPTPTPTPRPTPTPCQTRRPAATHSAGPGGSATAAPTGAATVTASPTPTPTPTPVVMFADLNDPIIVPAAAGSNGRFDVWSLTGASCTLHRGPVPGDNVQKNSLPFIVTRADGYFGAGWGRLWTTIGGQTITAWVTCSLSGYPDATSGNVTAVWPYPPPPTASPT
jgi:hypothetical protein